MNFWIKKKLILWISASKRRSFPTQETGTEMIFPWYLRNLHDFLRNEKDDISVLLGNIVFRARNFVQVNTLCNVVPEAANNFAQEKTLCNVVLIFLGLYYTGQNFTQFYQSGCRQHWIRKSPVQCCLDTLGTTFNRPKFCAMLPKRLQKNSMGRNPVQNCLNTLGTTLHRSKPCAILSERLQTKLYQKTSCLMLS